ncbi:MAG: hypothetical protein WAN66_04640 [Limnoraphis robusta]|uniref:Uncharacterized protein n=1 Tax=Limnoraphis robusta CS-951 TaxID=1637645 RepID=A0A0F5YJL8_9CYAN|nr:hypothetical protein [Limnoraphis robusta]KKD39099.1 hypothetical protein WN50_05285 [Limnoraphis robusta CS-951]KMW70433.1 hypothetical protein WN50_35340 [Limnoraphis robusta CS-951]
MKILSIPVWVTVMVSAVCLFSSPMSQPFSQTFICFANNKNNVPPEVKDGGSRFSQPRKNFDIDTSVS